MTYAAINARRMPYDVDGTEVGYREIVGGSLASAFSLGVQAWFSSANKVAWNTESQIVNQYINTHAAGRNYCQWFFFPEIREITHIGLLFNTDQLPAAFNDFTIQGSNNTTNGMDGTWETPTFVTPTPAPAADYWRDDIFAVAFSGPKKALRIGYRAYTIVYSLASVHIYGLKAAGQTPDDILVCNTSGDELTSLLDWGDQPEGTTEILNFKLKNASTDKIANNINLQLNHADFALAWSADGPWTSVLDIATLGIGALSNTIYVRNQLGPPLLILGPYAARVIASVGSWS
jgi:hypothetical protein